MTHVYVLGDPAYYGRSGFIPEPAIAPPYALPEEWRDAWQSLSLGDAPQPPTGNADRSGSVDGAGALGTVKS